MLEKLASNMDAGPILFVLLESDSALGRYNTASSCNQLC